MPSPAVLFPAFFDQVPRLRVTDALAAALGVSAGGVMEYAYADAVRLAGHSCPTVAGAWLMGSRGLAALYPGALPVRGGVRVEMRASREDGTAGVVGSVLTLLTGAAGPEGFKGLAGRHVRRDQLRFSAAIDAQVRITRLDDGTAVLLDYRPDIVPLAAEMAPLMARVLDASANPDKQAGFARLWQDRVRRILLEHADDPALLSVRPA